MNEANNNHYLIVMVLLKDRRLMLMSWWVLRTPIDALQITFWGPFFLGGGAHTVEKAVWMVLGLLLQNYPRSNDGIFISIFLLQLVKNSKLMCHVWTTTNLLDAISQNDNPIWYQVVGTAFQIIALLGKTAIGG